MADLNLYPVWPESALQGYLVNQRLLERRHVRYFFRIPALMSIDIKPLTASLTVHAPFGEASRGSCDAIARRFFDPEVFDLLEVSIKRRRYLANMVTDLVYALPETYHGGFPCIDPILTEEEINLGVQGKELIDINSVLLLPQQFLDAASKIELRSAFIQLHPSQVWKNHRPSTTQALAELLLPKEDDKFPTVKILRALVLQRRGYTALQVNFSLVHLCFLRFLRLRVNKPLPSQYLPMESKILLAPTTLQQDWDRISKDFLLQNSVRHLEGLTTLNDPVTAISLLSMTR